MMKMGLIDKVNKSKPSVGGVTTEERAEQLLEAVDGQILPSGVELLRESEDYSGGRGTEYLEGGAEWFQFLFFQIIFLGFLIVPSVFVFFGLVGLFSGSPAALILICVGGPILFFSGPYWFKLIFNPDPIVLLTTRTYYDGNAKFFLKTSEEENISYGETYETEIDYAVQITSKHRITALYDPGSDGAVRSPSYSIFVWEEGNENDQAIIFLERLSYNTTQGEAEERALLLGRRMSLKATDPIVQDEWTRFAHSSQRVFFR
tara:strand:- start:314 stop:1096 length:783 start_codon:yes stop_codon:yes gene_type:complete